MMAVTRAGCTVVSDARWRGGGGLLLSVVLCTYRQRRRGDLQQSATAEAARKKDGSHEKQVFSDMSRRLLVGILHREVVIRV